MQLIIYIHCWLLFFNSDNFKYTVTSQRLTFNFLPLLWIFLSHRFLSYHLFWNSHSLYRNYMNSRNLYRISYTLRFCYVMHYLMPVVAIAGSFFEDSFYCYSRQIISAVTNESLTPNNLIKRGPQTQNV